MNLIGMLCNTSKKLFGPWLKTNSTAVCSIYGAYPSKKVLQLHNAKEGFLIQGRAINAQEVVKKSELF
jgi:hypothetical protein